MNSIFNNNLLNLRQGSAIFAVFAFLFAFYPMVFEHGNIFKTCVFIGVALISTFISFLSNYLMQMLNIRKRLIFALMSIFHTNLVIFGTYIGVWSMSSRDGTASIFGCLLVCSLLLFTNPPQFNFVLTLCASVLFAGSSIILKEYKYWTIDLINAIIAGSLCIYFSWHITKLRMGLEISTTMLEDEMNKAVDQSITDELTQLRNRRDFNQTFQRFLSNYRTSDEWLCVALADIDFFKFYNDTYGHPQGDECLRGIGKVLNSLNALGVYTARVGGEEFGLLWFETDPSHVEKIVSHWTEEIRSLKMVHEKSKVSEYVTMSIGIYIVRCGTHQHDTKALYDLADKALYTAKSSGRNCAIVLGDEIKEYKITPKNES